MKNCGSNAPFQARSDLPFSHPVFSLIFLLAAIGIFYAATIRPGHVWGDDFAMYVHHAQNIVERHAYSDTGYIYNPAVPAYSPGMYPPIFPVVLAPLYKLFGLNLWPMKLEQIIFFLLTLAIVFRLWRRELGTEYALALVAILGFSPVFWNAKDSVLSDLPFLLLFYVNALLVHRSEREEKRWLLWSLLLGLTLYLAVGTRTAGIALLPGLLLYDIVRQRKITRRTAVALALCTALMLLQGQILGSAPGGYMEQIHAITPRTIAVNTAEYTRVLAGFWVASTRNAFSFLVLAAVGLLALAGIVSRGWRGFSIVEAFLLPYGALLLLWPYPAGIRVAFPFVPWIGFLVLAGLWQLSAKFAPLYYSFAIYAFLLLLAVSWIQAYGTIGLVPIRESEGLPEFNQLCRAVREQTGSQDIFIYYRARALSLYTGRRASSYNHRGSDAELQQYSAKIHASYLIVTSAFNDDRGFLNRYVSDNAADLHLTYENASFRLYRILPSAQTARAETARPETQGN